MSNLDGGIGPPEILWEAGQPLPAFACLDGIEVAIISKADWHELEMLRARQGADARRPPLRLSKIILDAEVASFISGKLGKVEQRTILDQVRERFGDARTPSPSALSRFVAGWRRERT